MTLALTALAVATLARLSSRGLALVLEARTRHEALQREWANLSCRVALLDDAERLLGDSDAAAEAGGLGWPYPAERHGWFVAGGVRYDLLLADEQAKLGLNAVHELRPEKLASLLANASRSTDHPPPLRSGAASPVAPTGDKGPAYRGWGQLVDLPHLALAAEGGASLVELSRRFTLMEQPRLNTRRATNAALTETARLVLTPAEAAQLVEARQGHTGELRDWLDSVDLPSRRLVPLRRLLTDRSNAYSLWTWSEGGRRVTMASVGVNRGQRQPRVLQWP